MFGIQKAKVKRQKSKNRREKAKFYEKRSISALADIDGGHNVCHFAMSSLQSSIQHQKFSLDHLPLFAFCLFTFDLCLPTLAFCLPRQSSIDILPPVPLRWRRAPCRLPGR